MNRILLNRSIWSARSITSLQKSNHLFSQNLVKPNSFRYFSNIPKKENWSPVASDETEAAAIAQTKEFMQAAKDDVEDLVSELTQYSDWQPKVMEQEIPVILDCYAEWCKPCKKLEPILREKIKEFDGKLKMVKLNIDDLPKLSSGLNIRSIPAVFLIYKGNIVDMFQGVPEESALDEFFNTGALLNQLQTDEAIMGDVLSKVEEMIKSEEYEKAHQVLTDSLALPAWREKHGTQMIIAQAYCKLYDQKVAANTIEIRKSIENLVEQKILDLPPFWQKLAFDLDTQLQQVEQQQGIDDKEISLRDKIHAAEDQGKMPDLQDMQDLADHLIAKNRMQEAIDILLDSVAIDRNWNKRAAQTTLTDVFKKVGTGSDMAQNGRKKLSKLLF